MASFAGGYDLDFVDTALEEFSCCVCHLTLKEPVKIENCGYQSCELCFSQMKDQAERRYFSCQNSKIFSYNRLTDKWTLERKKLMT